MFSHILSHWGKLIEKWPKNRQKNDRKNRPKNDRKTDTKMLDSFCNTLCVPRFESRYVKLKDEPETDTLNRLCQDSDPGPSDYWTNMLPTAPHEHSMRWMWHLLKTQQNNKNKSTLEEVFSYNLSFRVKPTLSMGNRRCVAGKIWIFLYKFFYSDSAATFKKKVALPEHSKKMRCRK